MSISCYAAVSTQLNAIFVSLELSRSTWLVTSLSPGRGERISRHQVKGSDVPALLGRFAQLQAKTRERTGEQYPLVVIQEAGLDGFWIHRCLVREGIESHVVDAASIAASRRSRRAKTDKLDGEALVRTLLAYKRGEPRVCAMVKVASAITTLPANLPARKDIAGPSSNGPSGAGAINSLQPMPTIDDDPDDNCSISLNCGARDGRPPSGGLPKAHHKSASTEWS